MPISESAFWRLTAAAGLILPLAGCLQPAFTDADRDWALKRDSAPFVVLSAKPSRAVVSARGNLIAIAPTDGFCVSEEAIDVSSRSVFALLSDCAVETVSASTKLGVRGELRLPKAVPAIVTVSISGRDVVEGAGTRRTGLANLEAFLDTDTGLRMLGRGSGASSVTIVETERVGDVLYVLVEDADRDLLPMLGARFWRAFMEINERIVVVTFSGFRDNPIKSTEMLEHLRAQVASLKKANRVAPRPDDILVASDGEAEPRRFPEALRTAAAVAIAREGGTQVSDIPDLGIVAEALAAVDNPEDIAGDIDLARADPAAGPVPDSRPIDPAGTDQPEGPADAGTVDGNQPQDPSAGQNPDRETALLAAIPVPQPKPGARGRDTGSAPAAPDTRADGTEDAASSAPSRFAPARSPVAPPRPTRS